MTQSGLNVTIIGGGLAGALAARVLREHHNVTVLERSSDPAEVGAAINVAPNGTRILQKLNFDPTRTGSIPVGSIRTWNKSGEVVGDTQRDYAKDYGSPWLFQHRADLRAEFLRLATAPSAELGLKGSPATVRYGAKVVDVDVESGTVTLEGGEKLEADLLIGGDGVKSIVRALVVGDDAFKSARPSGLSAFRFTLPREEVLEKVPNFRILDKSKPATLDMVFSFDPSQRFAVLYPCRNFDLLNFVCIVPDGILKTATTESWSATGDVDELLGAFQDFPPWLLDLFKLGKNIKLWQLRDQDPLPTYVKGKTALIGDAAHAMTPHQGQGGTQAIEDAEGFELFNRPGVTAADVPRILKEFDSVRRPRASQIQDNTRQSVAKKSAEEVLRFERYNWTYPGVIEGLRRVQAGEDLIQL